MSERKLRPQPRLIGGAVAPEAIRWRRSGRFASRERAGARSCLATGAATDLARAPILVIERADIIREGHTATLRGVQVEDLSRAITRQLEVPTTTAGVVITSVDPSSAAAAADLEGGDVIQEVNPKSVRNVAEYDRALAATDNQPALLLVRPRWLGPFHGRITGVRSTRFAIRVFDGSIKGLRTPATRERPSLPLDPVRIRARL